VNGLDVGLDVGALAARVVLQLPTRGAERIADCDVEIFMCAVEGVISADLDVGSGNRDRHANVIALTLVMVLVRALDGDVAAFDAIVDRLELGAPAPNEVLDGSTWLEIAKGDYQRNGHGSAPSGRLRLSPARPDRQYDPKASVVPAAHPPRSRRIQDDRAHRLDTSEVRARDATSPTGPL
jgi:hypothetical protein